MTTITASEFVPVGEVTADSRSRIAFGRASIHAEERFLVSRRVATGEILLTPVTSIPTRELDIWENKELLAALVAGLMQKADGDAAPWPEMDAQLDDLDDADDA